MGVGVGVYIFHSFEDLRVWVKLHLPRYQNGFFLDIVSLLDLFPTSQVDHAEHMGTMHGSQKTGHASTYESPMATPMQATSSQKRCGLRFYGQLELHAYTAPLR